VSALCSQLLSLRMLLHFSGLVSIRDSYSSFILGIVYANSACS